MASTANNTANVAMGGGVKGRYLYSAPRSATLPTDYATPLSDEFVNLGYVTSDGITISDSEETSTQNDLNGDPIATSVSSSTHTVAFTLAEIKKDSLAEEYGHANVTDADGMITVTGASGGYEERIYVIDLIFGGKRRGRIVYPNASHQTTGDLTVSSANLYARQVTIVAMPDEAGNSFYQYFQSTETQAPAKATVLSQGEVLGKDVSTFGTFELNGTKMTGTANKVTGYTEFNKSDPNEQEGYYAPLTIEPWEGTEVVSSRKPENRVKLKDDPTLIVFLGKEEPQKITLDIYPAQGKKQSIDIDVTKGE